jgi:hypothetical protein
VPRLSRTDGLAEGNRTHPLRAGEETGRHLARLLTSAMLADQRPHLAQDRFC